jgi:hypothetical protein
MRGFHWIIAASILTLPAAASAQDSNPPQQQTTTVTTIQTTSSNGTSSYSGWMASGFVGSNFGASADDASLDFGGQLAYMFKNAVGAEFLADFAPKFKINNVLLANEPNVNSYMVNAIGALPIGDEGFLRPYVSGGVGAIQLRSDVLNVVAVPASGFQTANQTRFGGNIGFGVMGFAGNVGVRGDVRYYKAFTNADLTTNANTPAEIFAQNLLSGLDFWRANIGVAVRW